MITKRTFNVDLASLSVKKIWYDRAKKMYFDVKAPGNESARDCTLTKLPKIHSIMVSVQVFYRRTKSNLSQIRNFYQEILINFVTE